MAFNNLNKSQKSKHNIMYKITGIAVFVGVVLLGFIYCGFLGLIISFFICWFYAYKLNKTNSIIKTSIWLVWDFSGLRLIWNKVFPEQHEENSKSSSFFLWLIGIYVAFFGIASQRYEKQNELLEKKVNFICSQISSSDRIVKEYGFLLIPETQATKIPIEPDILYPDSVFMSLFKSEKNKRIGKRLKNLVIAYKEHLMNLNLENIDLSNINLENAKFMQSNLSGANFEGTNLWMADFSSGELQKVNFNRTCLQKAKFIKLPQDKVPNLRGSTFINADLINADFTGANLSRVNFENAYIDNTDFSDADILGLDFTKSRYFSATFSNNIKNAKIPKREN